MQDFFEKKILIGICGGVAAYKVAYLVRELRRLNAQVRVMMTASAQQFISALTFQALSGHKVGGDLFAKEENNAMEHIELARWADFLLIAPASANCLAKMAQGLADDLLSTVYLATEGPVILCPAMNRAMWQHPATQENVDILKTRGHLFVGPEEGSQACGDEGFGRLAEVGSMVNALWFAALYPLLAGQKILITAGPTREALDPVRYLSNRSSGKMGYALAEAAAFAGASVILISGPTALLPPSGVETHYVESAKDMQTAVSKHLKKGMIFIGCAAVADYSLPAPLPSKIKKTKEQELTLSLSLNPDILKYVAASGLPSFIVGFAAETEKLMEHAKEKFKAKKLDMLIANQVGKNLGFETDDNQVTIITKEKELALPRLSKIELAEKIIAILAASIQNVGRQKLEYAP